MSETEGPWSGLKPPLPPPRRPRWRIAAWLAVLAAFGAVFLALDMAFPGQLSGTDRFQALRLLGVLALVSSGLVVSRRFSPRGAIRSLAAWTALAALLIAGYAFRDDLGAAALRLRLALVPSVAVADGPRSLVVGRAEGGGFYVMGQVNGAPARFMIDTGSTEIVLSPADAARAGIAPDAAAFSHAIATANGVGYGARAEARSLTVGSIRMADVPVAINRAPMAVSLLGMPFLERLDSFEARGDRLYLRGR